MSWSSQSSSSSSAAAERMYHAHHSSRMTTPMCIPVHLNIYDLHPYNTYLHCAGLGAYHSGVEIAGKEYSYGYHNENTSGVFEIIPGTAEGAEFRHQIYCGDVHLTLEEWIQVMDKIKKQFIGRDYHILRHNCNHFSRALLHELHLPFPSYINRLAYVVSCLECCIPWKYKELLGIVTAPSAHDDDDSISLVSAMQSPSYTRLSTPAGRATPTSYIASPAVRMQYSTMRDDEYSYTSPRDHYLLEQELDTLDIARSTREQAALDRITHISRETSRDASPHTQSRKTRRKDSCDVDGDEEEDGSKEEESKDSSQHASVQSVTASPIQLDLLETSSTQLEFTPVNSAAATSFHPT